MSTRSVVDTYYELANKGYWDDWCNLFAPDLVMDEQLAGHIEGREPLRKLVSGFPDTWAYYSDVPRYVVVDGEQASVVSHLSTRTHDGKGVEVDVATYFRVVDDQMTYLANFHDSAPFAPILGG